MNTVNLSIDGEEVQVPLGTTILEAARSTDIYIPTLCHHPVLPPAQVNAAARVVFQGYRKLENAMPEQPAPSCGLCVVEVAGAEDLVVSCVTEVKEAMTVITNNDCIKAIRPHRKHGSPLMKSTLKRYRNPKGSFNCWMSIIIL